MGRFVSVLALIISSSALAQEAAGLRCTQTFNGAEVLIVDGFPATVNVKFTITNTDGTSTLEATTILAPILQSLFMDFAGPLRLAPGASFTSEKAMSIPSLSSCTSVARWDGEVDGKISSAAEITWSGGLTHCSGAILCRAPQVCR